jgi:phosphoenolpyruvate-protein phosphotransferase (PTS system enzyme I)
VAKTVLHGIAVSAGISIGQAFFMNRHHYHLIPRQTVAPSLIPAELVRLEQAFDTIKKEFESARSKVPPNLTEHAAIIDTHLMICNDPKLLGSAKRIVEQVGITAEWALEKAMAEIEEAFSTIEVAYIRDRFQDISLVADRVQAQLLGHADKKQSVKNLEGRVVLMAHDLTPGDTIELDVNKIMSFATVQGGKTSHTGILARSLRIPALVGVTDLEESVADGDLVVIDGLKGKVVVEPDEEELTYYADLKYRFESYHKGIIRSCRLPGETVDGYRLDVLANVELNEEIPSVLENGGEGIGLFRTEYAFLNRLDSPDEEELYKGYKKIAETMAPGWVVFRTLDVGADKIMAGAESLEETNPALGLRAIRYCLKNTDLFMRQLRAILRASAVGNVALMFPMISGLHEVLEAKRYLEQAQKELHAKKQKFNPYMPVGIMIELPSAVTIAEVLAPEVDFFSIGTNDLIQYSLGIDRTNKHVSYLYQPLHPAVLRSIKHVVDAAHEAGIEVSVCGEVASDPYCFPILMGMQVDGVSITPQAIPGIKRIIRRITLEDCQALLKEVLASSTVAEINRTVKDTIFKHFPDELMFYSSVLDMDES